MRSWGPQRKAAFWHKVDAIVIGAGFAWAVLGLWGHYQLRKEYHQLDMARRNEWPR